MRRLLLGCAVVAASATMFAQAQTGAGTPGRQTTPAPRPATPATQTPAPPRTATPPPQTTPAPRPAAQAARRPAPARGGVTVVVTSMTGMPLAETRVLASGPTERSGTTDGLGRLMITGMQAGTYRLRFVNENYVEFEREVTVRGGPNLEMDVSLRPAPPPKVVTVTAPAPPPAPAPAPAAGPTGQPQVIPSLATLVTREFLQAPRSEALISCSGNTRVTLVQMTQAQPTRLYENAEVTYYVLGGEGTIQVGGQDAALRQESLVSIPRGVPHSLAHRGRRNAPLVLVAQLSGEPCEQAK